MTPPYEHDPSVANAALAAVRADPHDDAAWRAVYLFYRRQVLGTLFILGVRDAVDREDLSSEVFFRFVSYSPWSSNWPSLPGAQVIASYLRTITRNVAWTAARKRARGRALAFELAEGTFEEDESAASRDLLDALNRDERRFFQTYVESGFSLSRVAVLEGLSYSGAGTRLHRIRRKLKQSGNQSASLKKKPSASGID